MAKYVIPLITLEDNDMAISNEKRSLIVEAKLRGKAEENIAK
jgi:hypothetical protein